MNSSHPRWHEVTALFGGTFDPPHLGHREAVRGLFRVPGVKAVRVIPAASPPLKTSLTLPKHRLEMARIAFASDFEHPYPAEVSIDSRELDRAEHLNRPSFTFETLSEIGQSLGPIAFVVGADQLKNLHHWHRFPDILSLSHWIVLARQPQGEKAALSTLSEWQASSLAKPEPALGGPALWRLSPGRTFLTLVPTEAQRMSSTDIRESLARKGQPPEGTLLPKILAYLNENRLYGTDGKR